MSERLLRYLKIGCPGLILLSFGLFLFTLSEGAYPGESASLIAYHTGLDPFDTLLQPVWGLVARLVALISGNDFVTWLNVFSALCGALSVGLLFVLVAGIPHDRTLEEERSRFSASRVQALSGLAAALFFLFSIPFWSVANRAHYATFDVLLMLICTWLLMRVWIVKSRRLLYFFAFLYGVGMVQSAAFILAAPVFAVLILYRLFERNMIAWRLLLTIAGWALLGFILILPAALRFYFTPAYEWRSISGFPELVWILIRDQGRTALSATRQVGWLLLLLVNILPWLAVVAINKTGSKDRSKQFGSILLHVIVLGLGGILLFNIPPSPMAIMGDGSQLVFAYLVSAVWFGYVIGYWYILIGYAGVQNASFNDHPWRAVARIGWLALVGVAVVLSGMRNFSFADARGARSANLFAEAVLDGMEDREWLISNGFLDANVYIAAAQRQKEVIILNPRLANIPAYLKYMASLTDEQRLQGLAQLGLWPFMREWLETDTDIEDRLAVMDDPSIWLDNDFYPIPSLAVFVGQREVVPLDEVDAYLQRHRELWQAFLTIPVVSEEKVASMYDRWTRRHISRMANNVGVYLEDHELSDAAFESYATARLLDEHNISALMNQLNLAIREERPDADDLDVALDELLESREGRPSLWALSANYGFVRDPQAFVRQGLSWAMSGRLRTAVRDVERAMAMTGGDPQLQRLLATLYLRGDRVEEGEQFYLQMLEEDPEDTQALSTLFRSALARGDGDLAEQYWERLVELGIPAEALAVEFVALKMIQGENEEARRLLQAHVRNHPKDARAWALLVMVAERDQDQELMTRTLAQLTQLDDPAPEIRQQIARAQVYMGYLSAARDTLNRILRSNPAHVSSLEQILRLDVMEGDQDAAQRHVQMLLSFDSGHPLGNYILSTLQAARGDYALAETSLRRSLQRLEMPEALNDLAWMLQMRGAYEEAYPLARRAMEMNPRNPASWSTLGRTLLHLGRVEEASEALHQAIQLSPDHPVIKLNLVELYKEQGLRADAIALLVEVEAQLTMLPESDRLRALTLSTQLRQ